MTTKIIYVLSACIHVCMHTCTEYVTDIQNNIVTTYNTVFHIGHSNALLILFWNLTNLYCPRTTAFAGWQLLLHWTDQELLSKSGMLQNSCCLFIHIFHFSLLDEGIIQKERKLTINTSGGYV